MSFLLLLALCGPLAALPAAQEPSFQTLDPGKLKVKVNKIEDSLDGVPSALVTVTVSNPTDFWAEPLEFLIPTKKRKDVKAHRAPRVEPPYFGRAGRGIPPGGKLSYLLSLPEDPKQLSKSGVKVLQASFFEGVPVSEPPVIVGEIDEAASEPTIQGGEIRFSRVLLKNTTDFTIDAILRAEFKYPKAGDALIRFRLEPQEEKRCTVEGPQLRVSGGADLRGSDLKSVELVDWSALRPSGEDPAVALLRAVYEAQASWPHMDFRYEADYEVEIHTWDWDKRERIKIVEKGICESNGRFAQFRPKGGEVKDAAGLGRIALNSANRHLHHASFEEWLEDGAPTLHSVDGELTIAAVLYSAERKNRNRYYWIQEGVIVAQASHPNSGEQQIYERGRSGGKEVVLRELMLDLRYGPSEWDNTAEFEYAEIDGITIPVRVRRVTRFNPTEQNIDVLVKLSEVRVVGAPQAQAPGAVPTGRLAEQVRAAWERGYRVPDHGVNLRGDFVMTNSGTDALWHGHREVRGSFQMVGYHGTGWGNTTVTLEGDYTEETGYALQEVVRDRFGMYMSRDLSGRASFDEQFAGARFEKKGKKIVVHDCAISEMEIRAGRIRSYDKMGHRELRWKAVDGVDLLTRAKHGKEMILFEREQIAGVWIPVQVEMHDVFEDWGPEYVTLSSITVD